MKSVFSLILNRYCQSIVEMIGMFRAVLIGTERVKWCSTQDYAPINKMSLLFSHHFNAL